MSSEVYVKKTRSVISRSGDAIDTVVLLDREPTSARMAATKAYVDAHTGGVLMGANVVPSHIGRYYTHNAPGFPGNTNLFSETIMCAMFVGQVATWDEIAISHAGGAFPLVKLSVWELNSDTLLPELLVYDGAIESPVGSTYRVAFDVQTISDWIGLAVFGGGNFGGFLTVDSDSNGAVFGQFTTSVFGFTDALTIGAEAECLYAGGSSPLASAFVPTQSAMPRIGIRLASLP